jgi:hypothetical protein
MEINQKIIEQAELDAPLSGYDTDSLWMVPVDRFGKLMLQDASGVNIDASQFYVKTTFDDGTIKYYHKDWKGPQDKNTPQWIEPPTTENLELYGIPVIDTSIVLKSPRQNYYLGYLVGDTIPPNGYPV